MNIPAGAADGMAVTTQQHRDAVRWRRPDACRMLQLALGTVWLLDGILQLQPFMFTPGSNGLSGMLGATATGNPNFVARSITWNAAIVDHHAVATNTAFALIQVLIGLGIAWRPSVKPALVVSMVWSLGVWWFGEGLGGILQGAATPVGGGPGAVLFYALLAVLLWPTSRGDATGLFVAAKPIGSTAAKVVWAVVWLGLALLALVGSGRAPQGLHDLVASYSGEPGWLAAIDRNAEALLAHRGLDFAILIAVACILVAGGVFLRSRAAKASLVLAIATGAVIWVVGENFGGVLAGGATDPSSGPLLILLALAYWPLQPTQVVGSSPPLT
jgi:hypothetical protein